MDVLYYVIIGTVALVIGLSVLFAVSGGHAHNHEHDPH